MSTKFQPRENRALTANNRPSVSEIEVNPRLVKMRIKNEARMNLKPA